MSRTTAILALVQALLVTLGFFALAIILKALGYPASGMHFSRLAVFLRTHGFWLICLPVAWVCLAVRVERRDYGILSYRTVWLGGVCIAASIISLFLYAAVFP
jgi:hypothetical protein